MRLLNNVLAMKAMAQYKINTNSMIKSAERMGSGYRINKAGDNPAGLALSEKMRSQIRGLNMASKNASDGISIVQTAEGALQEVHSMLQRMNELAVQSATGTNQSIDRNQLSREFNQLKNEINDISRQTTFNNQRILDGSLSAEGAFRDARAAGIYVAPVEADAINSVSIANSSPGSDTPPGEAAEAEFSLDFSKLSDGDGIEFKIADVTIASVVFDSTAMSTVDDVFDSIISSLDGGFTASYAGNSITITANAPGYAGDWEYAVTPGENSPRYTLISFDASMFRVGDELTLDGNTATWAEGMILDDFISGLSLDPSSYELAGDTLKIYAEYTQEDIEAGFVSGPSTDKGAVHIQVGALKNELLKTEIKAMSTRGLGLDGIDILTQDQAGAAVTATRDAIEKVSAQRSLLGAMQNRLELKGNNLDNAAENLQTAEGKIRDTDIALEMTTYTKVGMLLQSSTEMIRQANDLPANIINLLR